MPVGNGVAGRGPDRTRAGLPPCHLLFQFQCLLRGARPMLTGRSPGPSRAAHAPQTWLRPNLVVYLNTLMYSFPLRKRSSA